MPKFGGRSLSNLKQLHPKLQIICNEAIKTVDFVLLDAQRGRAEQEKAYRGGFSKARWLQSAHNYQPGLAFDLAPWPIDWDEEGFKKIAKTIGYYDVRQGDGRGLALDLKIPLRWGADWDMDGAWNDERFLDWGHWELDPWREWAKSPGVRPIDD